MLQSERYTKKQKPAFSQWSIPRPSSSSPESPTRAKSDKVGVCSDHPSGAVSQVDTPMALVILEVGKGLTFSPRNRTIPCLYLNSLFVPLMKGLMKEGITLKNSSQIFIPRINKPLGLTEFSMPQAFLSMISTSTDVGKC